MKKILTIQDISCYGQCSLTVALPIISAMGIETCILPSAVLSTHTGGFKNYTFRDLTEDLPKIKEHWMSENIKFDGFYTGYIGSSKQIKYIKDIINEFKKENDIFLVDPVMADNGALYPGFNQEFVEEMKGLCSLADYIVPNITEASLLIGEEYHPNYTKEDVERYLVKLSKLGPKKVLITGISFEEKKLGVALYDAKTNEFSYYFNEKVDKSFHGTGDIYASVFFGGLMNGKTFYDAASMAVDFTLASIKETVEDADSHFYGVHFEKVLWMLTKKEVVDEK